MILTDDRLLGGCDNDLCMSELPNTLTGLGDFHGSFFTIDIAPLQGAKLPDANARE